MPATKRRPSPTWLKYERAVTAEVNRRLALREPITLRTLTIDFEGRTVTFRGRTIASAGHRCLSLPILNTEQVIWPRDPSPPVPDWAGD